MLVNECFGVQLFPKAMSASVDLTDTSEETLELQQDAWGSEVSLFSCSTEPLAAGFCTVSGVPGRLMVLVLLVSSAPTSFEL